MTRSEAEDCRKMLVAKGTVFMENVQEFNMWHGFNFDLFGGILMTTAHSEHWDHWG